MTIRCKQFCPSCPKKREKGRNKKPSPREVFCLFPNSLIILHFTHLFKKILNAGLILPGSVLIIQKILLLSSLNVWVIISSKRIFLFKLHHRVVNHCSPFGGSFFFFLAVLGLSCGMQDLRWGMRDLSLRCVGSSLQHSGFSLVVVCGFSLSSCSTQAPGLVGSVVVAHGLSCPAAYGILVPWPGIEPTSPA